MSIFHIFQIWIWLQKKQILHFERWQTGVWVEQPHDYCLQIKPALS